MTEAGAALLAALVGFVRVTVGARRSASAPSASSGYVSRRSERPVPSLRRPALW
jgi:hypothetical protein